jgi:hypothetical protein
VLTPSLKSNSAAALAGLLRTDAAQAAEAAPSRPLRVSFIVFIIVFLPSAWLRLVPTYRRPAAFRKPEGPETGDETEDETDLAAP